MVAKVKSRLSLERILSSQGFGSRKDVRSLIWEERVAVEGVCCIEPSQLFEKEGLHFSVDGCQHFYRDHVYIALHKPAQYECSRQPQAYVSVLSLLPYYLLNRGVQPVGRLDADTTGLLFLTDDGQWSHAMMSPRHHVAKTYRVFTKHSISDEMIGRLLDGVYLHDAPDEKIVADACARVSAQCIDLTISQGKYHQVKRMIAAVGNRVDALHRSQIGSYLLPPELSASEWCYVEPECIAKSDDESQK